MKPTFALTREDGSLFSWFRLQRSLAEKTGFALLTLERENSPVGPVENDNSICSAMKSSPELASLCGQDCGRAWSLARENGKVVHFRCHAGLNCFSVWIEELQAAVLGGRAFTSTSDYRHFLRSYGKLLSSQNGHCLANVKFCDPRELREAAELISTTGCVYAGDDEQTTQLLNDTFQSQNRVEQREHHLEVVREPLPRSTDGVMEILRDIPAAIDPKGTYNHLLAKVSRLMKAERCSLMILNDRSNELTLEAVLGFGHNLANRVRVKLGEPVAGAVLETGRALLIKDAESDDRVPRASHRNYRRRSFISFPIMLGNKKLGVINLTNRRDDLEYSTEDLMTIETLGPHIALLIDRAEWRRKAEQFQRMSLTDALTGLPNRRYLDERLFEEVERSKRHSTMLSFIIIDIDHFKSYNDLYGHTNADTVLVRTAQTLRRHVRAIDMSSRFAGDEFCIVLPETGLEDATRIAERLRSEISSTEYVSEQGDPMGRVTISIGISCFGPSRQSPLAIIEAADQALYQAKTSGRNCVVVHGVPQVIQNA